MTGYVVRGEGTSIGRGDDPLHINADNVLERLQHRDPMALSYLMDAYTGAVAALASRILAGVGTAEDVEECVSDTFVTAWNRANDYDTARGTVRTWLLVLAKYVALDARRKLMRHRHPAGEADRQSGGDPVAQQVLSREEQEELVACIQSLDPGVRDVIIRRYLLSMEIPAIAEALKITRTAVDNRLSRGRKQLRQQWDRRDGGGGAVGDV